MRRIFSNDLLSFLDARGRQEIEEAATVQVLATGQSLFREGEVGHSFFIILRGTVELVSYRGGARHIQRTAGPDHAVGEAVTVVPRRQSDAETSGEVVVVEVPTHLYTRIAARLGKTQATERIERTLRRRVARDVLARTPLAEALTAGQLDELLDVVTIRSVERGEAAYKMGDRSDAFFVVGEGLIQLQLPSDPRPKILAYFGRGDIFGEAELARAEPREHHAIANADATLLVIPDRALRSFGPDAFERLKGVRKFADFPSAAAPRGNATRHIFEDLHRVETASSLLLIDLDSCVRCGHCSWACGALHGSSHLVRRGEKLRAPAGVFDIFRAAPDEEVSVLLPNSCQHCDNPACMIECPTAAIGKDASGEVFIREALCTGCGACVRACPWDNIQLGARPSDAPRPKGVSATTVAQKCDLCASRAEGPHCVEVCPTSAISRVRPRGQATSPHSLLRAAPSSMAIGGGASRPSKRDAPRGGSRLVLGSLILSITFLMVSAHLRRSRFGARASDSVGQLTGWLSLALLLALIAYAAKKRLLPLLERVRPGWVQMIPLRLGSAPSWLRFHVVAGALAVAAFTAHAGPPTEIASPLLATLSWLTWAALASGLVLTLVYSVGPERLTRIEEKSLHLEDLKEEQEGLRVELFKRLSGRSELIKAIARTILIPYAGHPLGPFFLLVRGHTRSEESKRLGAVIQQKLEGRGGDRIEGLPRLIDAAVAERALRLQRIWLIGFRVLLPIHVVTVVSATALALVHVFALAWRVR